MAEGIGKNEDGTGTRRAETVLLVEDTQFFGRIIRNKIQSETPFQTVWARDMAEAVAALDEPGNRFFAAILDFYLPDSSHGEIIDEVVSRGIPVIVFTSDLSEPVRELVWSKNVADYALKDDAQSLDYILSMLVRIRKNPEIKILVVDDSVFFRKVLSDLLRVHRYRVLNAADGVEALEVLDRNPDIKLVLTDFSMPRMDGFTLTAKIRERFGKADLAIIGISSEGKNILAARFIKNGANDFIVKQSFLTEEFYSRVTQNIENLEHMQRVRDAAVRDFLTGLGNRRHFFDAGRPLFANAARNNLTLVCAMIDIDHFKKVNDTFGHEAGDRAIRHVAEILADRTREADVVARVGGEEFCVLAANMGAENAAAIFEGLRKTIEDSAIDAGTDRPIRVTVSIGVVTALAESLDAMVNHADRLLYQAKNDGRNRVVLNGRGADDDEP
jgi:diguanylate cyclase (GGDEF)-like protein